MPLVQLVERYVDLCSCARESVSALCPQNLRVVEEVQFVEGETNESSVKHWAAAIRCGSRDHATKLWRLGHVLIEHELIPELVRH